MVKKMYNECPNKVDKKLSKMYGQKNSQSKTIAMQDRQNINKWTMNSSNAQ